MFIEKINVIFLLVITSCFLSAWSLATSAAAAVSCPGACCGICSGSGAACTSAADCSGAACAFPDMCLPEAPELVNRVFPPDVQHIPTTFSPATGWWTVALPNQIYQDAGSGEVVITPKVAGVLQGTIAPYWFWVYHDFQLPRGKKYFLGAKVLAEPGTTGYFWLTGPVVFTDRIDGTNRWTQLGITFDVPDCPAGSSTCDPATSPLQLRLEADGDGGPGKVHFKDFVLAELNDFGTYIRAQLMSGAANASVELDALRHTYVDPGWLPTKPNVFGLLTPGAWSPWVTFDDWLKSTGRFTASFHFRDPNSGNLLPNVTTRFQVALHPDGTGTYFDRSATSSTGHLPIVLPEGGHNALGLKQQAALLTGRIFEDKAAWDATGRPPAKQPQRYWALTNFPFHPTFSDRVEDVLDMLKLFAGLGFSAIPRGNATLSAAAQAHGFNGGFYDGTGWQIQLPHPSPSSDVFNFAFDPDGFKQTLEATMPNWQPAADLSYDKARPDHALVYVGDEIAGFWLSGDKYTAAFHDYLTAKGVTPGMLGRSDFSSVMPASVGPTQGSCSLHPALPADPHAAALFYWQLRFLSEATGRMWQVIRDEVNSNKSWGGPYLTTANLGIPWLGFYYTYPRGVEAFTLARAGAFSMIFSEDWISFSETRNGADGEQLISLIADYTRAVAKAGGLRLGAHVVYGAPMDRKALSLVARGATHLSYYQYGPVDLVTEAAFAGYGQDSLRYFNEIHDAQDVIAKAEPWLSAASRAPSHVALIAGQTDPMWHCDEPGGRGEATTRDERGAYLALLHGHHPVDFVAEEDLASGGLDPYRVVYLSRQYVRDDAFAGLKRWVEVGGALELGPGHATHNEYAQAAPDRASWFGVTLGVVQAAGTDPIAVKWGANTLTVDGPWRTVNLNGPGTVLATYADGTPAAVEIVKGRGRVRIVGFELGRAYWHGVKTFRSEFQFGFQDVARAALLDLPNSLGVERPVWGSDPLVELNRLDGPAGGAIVAINYVNNPRLKGFQLTVPGPLPCVTSQATDSAPAVTQDGHGNSVITLDLGAIDVITWSNGTVNCGGVCTNTSTDPGNCGGCGAACGDFATCSRGQCVCDPRGPKCHPSCAGKGNGAACSVPDGCSCAPGTCWRGGCQPQ